MYGSFLQPSTSEAEVVQISTEHPSLGERGGGALWLTLRLLCPSTKVVLYQIFFFSNGTSKRAIQNSHVENHCIVHLIVVIHFLQPTAVCSPFPGIASCKIHSYSYWTVFLITIAMFQKSTVSGAIAIRRGNAGGEGSFRLVF